MLPSGDIWKNHNGFIVVIIVSWSEILHVCGVWLANGYTGLPHKVKHQTHGFLPGLLRVQSYAKTKYNHTLGRLKKQE